MIHVAALRLATKLAKVLAITGLVVAVIWFATAKLSDLFNFDNPLEGAVEKAAETVQEIFSLGGERIINPTELYNFYTLKLGSNQVLAHAYGYYHADGFVYIEGPGWADDENVLIEDAVYLGQVFIPADGIAFSATADGLIVQLPAPEYFATTLSQEPVIANPAELMAQLGQFFGSITDTKPFRDQLMTAVDERIQADQRLPKLAECAAERALSENILAAYALEYDLVLPPITAVSSDGEVIDPATCASIGSKRQSSSARLSTNALVTGALGDTYFGRIDFDWKK